MLGMRDHPALCGEACMLHAVALFPPSSTTLADGAAAPARSCHYAVGGSHVYGGPTEGEGTAGETRRKTKREEDEQRDEEEDEQRTGEEDEQRTGEEDEQRTGEEDEQRTGEEDEQRTGEEQDQRLHAAPILPHEIY
ncbi:Protein TIC 214 [Liparis tanakae]|uniref:Protein TIC 214 n=1 Tax=Liparis tanakae TaxID=230148 RepID=A0A4Z2GM71_9TELE|nr:Protein TIC 214 [Liparis tanakae]